MVYHRALCHHYLRRFHESILFLERCRCDLRQFAPDNVALGRVIFFEGVERSALGQFQQAEALFSSCLVTDWPTLSNDLFALVRFARGKALQCQSKHKEALEDFCIALGLVSGNPYFLFRRAWSYKGVGNLVDSATDFENAKLQKPADPNFAVDYRKISKFEYMEISSEPDVVHEFVTLLPVPGPEPEARKLVLGEDKSEGFLNQPSFIP